MTAGRRSARQRRRRPMTSRSPAWTRSSSRSATRGRPRTTTRPPSACAASPTAARRPAAATRPPTCCESGSARFVLRGPVRPGTASARHVAAHGDGVDRPGPRGARRRRGLRLRRRARRPRPGRAARRPRTSTARCVLAAIATYGDTRHTLVDRVRLHRPLPARLRRRASPVVGAAAARPFFTAIDHCVGNVELGQMDEWVELLPPGHGLHEHGGVRRRRHRHRLLGADEQGRRERQPPGQVPAQRAGGRARRSRRSTSTWSSTAARASSTSRWPPTTSCATVDALRAAGVEFLDTPDTYYDDPELRERIGEVRVPIEELQERGILVDRDEDGYLLQIFTKPVRTGRRCSSS